MCKSRPDERVYDRVPLIYCMRIAEWEKGKCDSNEKKGGLRDSLKTIQIMELNSY